MTHKDQKPVVYTFGRFQSPTIGHSKLVQATIEHAKKLGGEHRIYPSKSEDNTKNPIPYRNKIKHLRSLFPDANIVDDPKAISPHHVAKSLSDQGVRHVRMVVGADRADEFKNSIGKYVKRDTEPGYDPKKHYNFHSFDVLSAGDRDPDAEGAEGASGTKMREFAKKGDIKSFTQNTPTKNAKVARGIYNDVRKNLKEEIITINENLSHKHFGPMLDTFVDFASEKLGLKSLPNIKYKDEEQTGDRQPSFGGYNPTTNDLMIYTKNRHPMDIFRTVAHELCHHKQNSDGKLGNDIEQEGSTGSDIENEANSEAGKIMRWFAKANPAYFNLKYVTEEILQEGINDPSIMKVIFLAGGPGSGKDYVMKQTLDGMGLTEINSDNVLEHIMKKEGLSNLMPKSEERPRNIARGRAKTSSKIKQELAISGRRGIIVNGTGDDPEKIMTIKKALEASGYDAMMVFVNTNNDISKERNFMRGVSGGRKVPDGSDQYGNPDGSPDIRAEKWQSAQNARPEFAKIFGKDNYIEFDNSDDMRTVDPQRKEEIQNTLGAIYKRARQFTAAPHKNKLAIQWIESEIEKRQIKKFEKAKAQAYGDPNAVQQPQETPLPSYMTPQQNDVPDQNQLSQAQQLGLTYYGFGRYGKDINGRHTTTHISMNGKLVPKPVNRTTPIQQSTRQQPMQEEKKKMKDSDPCWSGYEMIGKKKKNDREVPNCVPVKENARYKNVDSEFSSFMEDNKLSPEKNTPSDREWGKTSTTEIYKNATPGQSTNKKLKKEDTLPPYKLEFGNDGVGPTATIAATNAGGLTGGGYSFNTLSFNESILRWANDPNTQSRFENKYGDLAEQRLIEAASRLNTMKISEKAVPKSIATIREDGISAGKDPTDTSGAFSGRGGIRGDIDESDDISRVNDAAKNIKQMSQPKQDYKNTSLKDLLKNQPEIKSAPAPEAAPVASSKMPKSFADFSMNPNDRISNPSGKDFSIAKTLMGVGVLPTAALAASTVPAGDKNDETMTKNKNGTWEDKPDLELMKQSTKQGMNEARPGRPGQNRFAKLIAKGIKDNNPDKYKVWLPKDKEEPPKKPEDPGKK